MRGEGPGRAVFTDPQVWVACLRGRVEVREVVFFCAPQYRSLDLLSKDGDFRAGTPDIVDWDSCCFEYDTDVVREKLLEMLAQSSEALVLAPLCLVRQQDYTTRRDLECPVAVCCTRPGVQKLCILGPDNSDNHVFCFG